jgi:hypothetical protein
MFLGENREDGGTSSHLRWWIGHIEGFCEQLDHNYFISKRKRVKKEYISSTVIEKAWQKTFSLLMHSDGGGSSWRRQTSWLPVFQKLGLT